MNENIGCRESGRLRLLIKEAQPADGLGTAESVGQMEEPPVICGVLRDIAGEQTHAIIVDAPEELQALREFARVYAPTIADRLRPHSGERPLFGLHAIEAEIKRHPLVSQCVVIGDRRPYLVALVTIDPEAAATYAQENGKDPADLGVGIAQVGGALRPHGGCLRTGVATGWPGCMVAQAAP